MYQEIINNTDQIKEWKKLFDIDENAVNKNFLLQNPFLVLDTAFFSSEFKEKLIESIDNLDETLDGLLIHSENFQALNLLQERYREQIKCVYIDPPYNTGNDGFVYKNGYSHSSWMSMMKDRLLVARESMSDDGVIFISIDDNEQSQLKMLCDEVFGEENFVCEFIRKSGTSPRLDCKHVSIENDFVLMYSENASYLRLNQMEASIGDYKFEDIHVLRRGKYKLNKLDRGSINYSPSLDYSITMPDNTFIYPGGIQENNGWCWRWRKEKVEWGIKNDFIVFKNNNVYFKQYQFVDNNDLIISRTLPYKNLLLDNYFNEFGNKMLINMFGGKKYFNYPKPLELPAILIKLQDTNDKSIILDYFAGSGTTAHSTINLNREDNGHRKYILVEMGEYFDTVMKPRIQKVIYSADWKDGKPVSRKGSSHAFKYIRLESYDDTLDNLEFESPQIEMTEPIREEYLLSYMLDIESRDSLFSIDKFSKPFSYSMKINGKTRNIDLVETFNYLIGLKVDKNYALKSYDAEFISEGEHLAVIAQLKNGSRYKIKMVSGTTQNGEKVLVIWRELISDITEDSSVLEAFFKDVQRDKYQKIYVNGDNNLLKLRTDQENWNVILIEEEFKKRMFEEVK